MEILYCDNHILIVNKPAGLATQSAPSETRDLTTACKEEIKRRYAKPGAVFLEPIHRLDKPVSGLVLFARTSKALSRLQEAMREQKIVRIYYALIEKEVGSGTLEHTLVHDEHKARLVNRDHPYGKKARLHYEFMGKRGRYYLVKVQLETGRYHQIRIQLSTLFPIVGDTKYGSTVSFPEGAIALHHGEIRFTHPVTREEMSFTASLPNQW